MTAPLPLSPLQLPPPAPPPSNDAADTSLVPMGNSFSQVVFPTPIMNGQEVNPASISDQDVLTKFSQQLRTLITESIDLELEPERYYQVSKALRNDLYWQGKQYLALGFQPGDNSGTVTWYNTADFAGQSSISSSSASFRYVFNIVRGDGMKFTAVLGQRAPHVEGVADDTEAQTGDEKQRQANALFRYLKDRWQTDHLQKDVARHIWRTGPVFIYTAYVADGAKYGYSSVPKVEIQHMPIAPAGYPCDECGDVSEDSTSTCPSCGGHINPYNFKPAATVPVPVTVGQTEYPNGAVEIQLATILEVTWTASAKSIAECNQLCYEYDEFKGKLLSLYAVNSPTDSNRAERNRKLIESEGEGIDLSAGKQMASDARAILLSQTNVRNPNRNLRRYSRYWIRPQYFELLKMSDAERQVFREKYPKGAKLTFISGHLIDITAECMDDVWAVIKTGTDEKILADPICNDIIPIQDIVNHHGNLCEETVLRAIPKVGLDPRVWDREALADNDPMPMEAIFARGGADGGDLKNSMTVFPKAEVSPDLVQLWDRYREMSRELDGMLPAIFGGGETAQTWREAAQRKNQALMQLGNAYDEMKAGWEKVFENGARQTARYSQAQINLPSDSIEGGMETVDFNDILQGGWHAEADEDVPMTHAEEVDRIMGLVTEAPMIAEKQEILSDNNAQRMSQLFTLRGFHSRKVQELEKFREVLPELLASGPIPAPPPLPPQLDANGVPLPPGPPPQPQPTVPIDTFADDPLFMAQAVRDWLNSREGRKQAKTNPNGVANVRAYGMAYFASAPAAPPAGGPTGPPPPGKGALGGGPPGSQPSPAKANVAQAVGVPKAENAPGGSAPGAKIPNP